MNRKALPPSLRGALAAIVVGAGCAATDESAAPEAVACRAGEIPSASRCCPAGSSVAGGGCVPAGVPPEACSPGFEPDTAGGCRPILPLERCPPGRIAVPGDATCRPIAPCGEARWGAIPDEPGTQHVDASYVGGSSDGTAARPWTTIAKALEAAAPGAIVAIASGSYAADILVTERPVRLWGRCPDMVELVGQGGSSQTLAIRKVPRGRVEVRDLAIRGPKRGVGITAAEVLLARVWIRDTGDTGLLATGELGPGRVTVEGALIEKATARGVLVGGAEAAISSSVIRDITPADGSAAGVVAGYFAGTASGSNLSLEGSVVEGAASLGVLASASALTLRATVVRGGVQSVSALAMYAGVAPVSTTVTGSVIEGASGIGLFVAGHEARVAALTVRDARRGLFVGPDAEAGTPGALRLGQTLLERLGDGLTIASARVEIDGLLVRDVGGQSIGPAGVVVGQLDGWPAAAARMTGSAVERVAGTGVFVAGGELELEGVRVTSTALTPAGLAGDAVVLFAGDSETAKLTLRGSHIVESARAGVASFAGAAAIEASAFECNLFDLNGEPHEGKSYTFTDVGGSVCGCEGERVQCAAQSSSLAPPPLPSLF
jgi:hypothetical protein